MAPMLIDGRKVSCEACIKGHRASQCQHSNRKLIELKRKGRPSTQCKRCRDLRLIRQLHVKCECEKPESIPGKKANVIVAATVIKPTEARTTIESTMKQLRTIAPRPDIVNPHTPTSPTTPLESFQGSPISCCSPSSSNMSPCQTSCPPSPQHVTAPSPALSSITILESPLPKTSNEMATKDACCDHPTTESSSCCSTEKVGRTGDRIRVITCRCGDSCACVGCDAHPSRVMKGQKDPYAGYSPRRRLSIAAICSSPEPDVPKATLEQPTSILAKDGTVLCGCGCSQPFTSCSDCFQELCDDYYTSQ